MISLPIARRCAFSTLPVIGRSRAPVIGNRKRKSAAGAFDHRIGRRHDRPRSRRRGRRPRGHRFALRVERLMLAVLAYTIFSNSRDRSHLVQSRRTWPGIWPRRRRLTTRDGRRCYKNENRTNEIGDGQDAAALRLPAGGFAALACDRSQLHKVFAPGGDRSRQPDPRPGQLNASHRVGKEAALPPLRPARRAYPQRQPAAAGLNSTRQPPGPAFHGLT